MSSTSRTNGIAVKFQNPNVQSLVPTNSKIVNALTVIAERAIPRQLLDSDKTIEGNRQAFITGVQLVYKPVVQENEQLKTQIASFPSAKQQAVNAAKQQVRNQAVNIFKHVQRQNKAQEHRLKVEIRSLKRELKTEKAVNQELIDAHFEEIQTLNGIIATGKTNTADELNNAAAKSKIAGIVIGVGLLFIIAGILLGFLLPKLVLGMLAIALIIKIAPLAIGITLIIFGLIKLYSQQSDLNHTANVTRRAANMYSAPVQGVAPAQEEEGPQAQLEAIGEALDQAEINVQQQQ